MVMGGVALADDPAPGQTEIAMDIALSSGRADVLVDDVPFFGPGQSLSADASIIASLPANTILGPRSNAAVIRFWPGDSGLGNEPGLRLRFGYAPTDTYPDAFSDRPHAVLVEITRDPDAALGFRLDHSIAGQPLLTTQVQPDLTQTVDEGIEARLDLDVQLALPDRKWLAGQPLYDDAATRAALIDQMRVARDAIAAGPEAFLHALGPMIARNAATVGMTPQQAVQTGYAPFFDTSLGFVLQHFDAEQAELTLMGNGRLATLTPSPIRFVNEEINESGAPPLL